MLPGRSGSSSSGYRYGFNGKEDDWELKGKGNSLDFGARMYDSRIGRWFAKDPKASKMPSWSTYSNSFNNPIKYIDENGEIPTPYEASLLAAHVYGDAKIVLSGGWKVSSNILGISKEKLNDRDSGFKSNVYERDLGNGKKEYAYVTAGTDLTSGNDWKNNAQQALGMSEQYDQSIKNAKEADKYTDSKGTELTFVGHSLGGGEAALNAMATGNKAITFNAAGVSNITKGKYLGFGVLKSFKNLITAYTMKTDPLNILQDNSPILPNVDGTREKLIPTTLSGCYNGHSINSCIDSLKPSESSLNKLLKAVEKLSDIIDSIKEPIIKKFVSRFTYHKLRVR